MQKLELGIITQAEAAKRLGVTRQYIWQLLATGKLQGAAIDGVRFVYAHDLERLKVQRRAKAKA